MLYILWVITLVLPSLSVHMAGHLWRMSSSSDLPSFFFHNASEISKCFLSRPLLECLTYPDSSSLFSFSPSLDWNQETFFTSAGGLLEDPFLSGFHVQAEQLMLPYSITCWQVLGCSFISFSIIWGRHCKHTAQYWNVKSRIWVGFHCQIFFTMLVMNIGYWAGLVHYSLSLLMGSR